jgi:hypothetical protein
MPWRRLGVAEYSSYSFLISALDGGEWQRPHRPLPPGKDPLVPIVQETEWNSQLVWTQRLAQRFSNCGARPRGGAKAPPAGGGRVICMRDILIVSEIYVQGKIYILTGTLLG